MSDFTNEDVVKAIGNLNAMELVKLTKELEIKWGVKALPQVMEQTVAPQQEVKVAQTEFDVVFVSFAADKKMTLIKLVRELLGTGLLEAKTLVESLPKTIKEGISKEDAEALKAKLTDAGGVIEIK
jgi:large subunit ribosomal protein L7/L12